MPIKIITKARDTYAVFYCEMHLAHVSVSRVNTAIVINPGSLISFFFLFTSCRNVFERHPLLMFSSYFNRFGAITMSLPSILFAFCSLVAMALALQNKPDPDLLSQLRRFSADQVKIAVKEQDWTKRLVDSILKENVFDHCQELSRLPIRKFEYTGSQYERLKTEAADVDVMVVLKTGKNEVKADEVVPGK